MRRETLLFAACILVAWGFPAWSATLEQAQQLHSEGRADEALAVIDEVLASDASDADKAAAMDLRGRIAVEQGRLGMARQAWERLMADFPDFAKSADAQTKLALVTALLGTRDEQTVTEDTPAEQAAAESAAEEPVEEVIEPAPEPEATTIDTETKAKVVTAETERPDSAALAPAPDEVPAAVASAPESTGLVLIAGRGRPHDAVEEASGRIVEFLRQRGVNAASATGGIPVVRESSLVLPQLLQKGEEEGASSVLLLTAEFSSMQKIVVNCYTPAGAELLSVKVSGGTGWTGRGYSATGLNESLLERFQERLDAKVGSPCLPVTR